MRKPRNGSAPQYRPNTANIDGDQPIVELFALRRGRLLLASSRGKQSQSGEQPP